VAVDPRGPGEQAVAGRVGDQVVDLAASSLRGDREAPVLHPRAGVDEVGDVLACGPPAAVVPLADRLGPRLVLGQSPPAQQLGEVVLGRRGFGHAGEPETGVEPVTSCLQDRRSAS
jgi:hypothetical protein